MFTRVKESRRNDYLQIVQNYRDGDRVRQRLVLYVGRYDSIDEALHQMPGDLRNWRARRTRMPKIAEYEEFARKEVEDLNYLIEGTDRRLQALSLRFNHEGFAMSFMPIAKTLAFTLFTHSGSRLDGRVAFGPA